MSNWMDKHSVNCIWCDALVDERECPTLPGGIGSVCARCDREVVQYLTNLCHCLTTLGYSCYFDDEDWTIVEEGYYKEVDMDDVLKVLQDQIDVAEYGKGLYDKLSKLV